MSIPGVPIVLSEDPSPSSGLTDGDIAIRSDGTKVQFFENNHWHTPSPPMSALVDDFGLNGAAITGVTKDATSACLAAIEKLRAAGGGFLDFTPGTIYRFTAPTVCVGVRFTDPAYVRPGIDWSNPIQNPSLDTDKLNQSTTYPRIIVRGNGAIIWGDFDGSNESPIFSYFIGEVHTQPNQATFGCSGLTIVGKEGFTGSPPTQNFASTPSTFPSANKQVGFFSVFSPCDMRDIEVRECYRGILTSDAYSSFSYKETASHCYDGISHFADNSAIRMKLKSTLCTNVGLKFSGQAPSYHGYLSEQCAVDYEVLSLDGGLMSGLYLENTTAAHTDFGGKHGDTTDATASQVIGLVVIMGHCFRQFGKPLRFHSSVYMKFDKFRSYTTGNVVNNTGCSILVETYPIDFAAGSFNNAAVTQFCPGQPGGTLQLAGGSGSASLAMVQGSRHYLSATDFLYSDGSGNIVSGTGLACLGNFTALSSIFFTTQIAGPGGNSAFLLSSNINNGQVGFDHVVSNTLTSGTLDRWRHGGGTMLSLDWSGKLLFEATSNDSTGSPGAATINKVAGKSAIASGATSVTITNSLASSTCIVTISPMDIDGTKVFKYSSTSGSFTVTLSSAATATWKFSWKIDNA